MIIRTQAHARAALLGNPSDGYYGKTIAFIIRNFTAEVTLWESPELEILDSDEDRSRFRSLDDLVHQTRLYGYYGGVRLIKAAIKKFAEHFAARNIVLPHRNFTLRYHSTIPRLVGLGGSSAIVVAVMRALMRFYDLEIPKTILPTLALHAETEELKIPAGLQDRVIQTYEGVVYMDFARHLLETQGYGAYEPLPKDCLPNLFVAYSEEHAEGTEVTHSDLRSRFDRGDRVVVAAMKKFASFAEQGRDAIVAGDTARLGELMNANFDLRRSIMTLKPGQIAMVEAARKLGAPCKFAGSGGAVVGLYSSEKQYAALRDTYRALGCRILKPKT
ncbi:MAG TPA: GHMP kinase [Planctomycetota bacterium]|mgnify:CR=1 FL=1|nr:GHMP kinase [Planctomycetota bacterium]HRR83056.1 GHMP kinase [Planctomycetota bacterium]HRT92984.1 GHMP kinase [Planctomycetota bacterium]